MTDWQNVDYKNPERRKKLAEKKFIPVFKYDMNGVFIEKYKSRKDAAEKNNIKIRTNITSCCNGDRKSCGGFIWKNQ